jgi:hypothetical protein
MAGVRVDIGRIFATLRRRVNFHYQGLIPVINMGGAGILFALARTLSALGSFAKLSYQYSMPALRVIILAGHYAPVISTTAREYLMVYHAPLPYLMKRNRCISEYPVT